MQYSGQMPTKLAGFSLLGDQGAESIHAKFNRLGLVIAPICERVENLLCIVNKHLLSIEPQLVAAIPFQLASVYVCVHVCVCACICVCACECV